MGILLAKQNKLLEACINGKESLAVNALRNGPNPRIKLWNRKAKVDVLLPDTNNSLAHIAAINGCAAVMRRLVEANAPLELRNNALLTPLMEAARAGYADVCSVLIEGGVDVELQAPRGNMALHMAAKAGHRDVCKVLIREGGCDPNAKGQNGYTPLHLAAHGGHSSSVRTLLDLGAKGKKRNAYGESALDTASAPNASNVSTRKILKARANYSYVDKAG